jgi:hypothetical protein
VVYGQSNQLVELLGERVGLSVEEINDAIIAYTEYHWFNDCHTFNDRDFVDMYFMGDTMGYDVLYAVKNQFGEIGALLPCAMTSLKYASSFDDGLYVVCTHDPHPNDFRFHSNLEAYSSQ